MLGKRSLFKEWQKCLILIHASGLKADLWITKGLKLAKVYGMV